jgi:hypothetical protein
MKTSKLFKEIKNVFKLPKKTYYLGMLKYGTPYFYPINFNSHIINIRKLKLTPQEELDKITNEYEKKNKRFSNLPLVRRSKYWITQIFGTYYFIEIGWPIAIKNIQLGWKDKFKSPRFEWGPSFQIYFFNWQFCIRWESPDGDDDTYYEMILWYLNYCNKDLNKAEKTWGWADYKTKLSTWNNNYLI